MNKGKRTLKLIPLLIVSIIILMLFELSIPLPFKWVNQLAVTELNRMIPGKWQIKYVRFSVLNGLVMKDVKGSPNLSNAEASLLVDKINVQVKLLSLLGRKIVPSEIIIKKPVIDIRTNGQSAALANILMASSAIPSALVIPVAKLVVEDAQIAVDGGFSDKAICKFDRLRLVRLHGDTVEGDFEDAKLIFAGNTILEKGDGVISGNSKTGNLSGSLKAKLLGGSIELKVHAKNGKIDKIDAEIKEAELSKVKLSQGLLEGQISGSIDINGTTTGNRFGSASLDVRNMLIKDFAFQNEARIEWLLPAIRTISMNSVDVDLGFKNQTIEIVKLYGSGSGMRLDLNGSLSYSGMFKSNLTLFLNENMVKEIPYITAKALPKNGQGEYVIPASLEGTFPKLEVKVQLSLVTRAVGGILKDVIKKLF